MAMHCVADIFAHDTYRKSDKKEIVHDNPAPSGKIYGADKVKVVQRRYDAAKYAVEGVVVCALNGVFGDWCEVDAGLEAPEYSDNRENFRKSKLLTYTVQNGLDNYFKPRVTAASIND